MAQNLKKSISEFLNEITNDYLKEHPGQADWTMEDAAAWAIRKKLWHPPRRNMVKWCASELAKAAREDYGTDPQGRRVRKKHARRETVTIDGKPRQMVFWAELETALPGHMRVSLQQRRNAILADNAQLKRDTDSYNDNNLHGAYIQMSFDYTEDLLESEAPEEYPDAPKNQSEATEGSLSE